MMFRRGKTFLAAFAAGLVSIFAALGDASAAPPPKGLWATVNICDTLSHPDQMGVRANMPGNGTRQRMYMRFHAQFYNQAKKQWFNVKGSGVSGWIFVGNARVTDRQGGYTFSFAPPRSGGVFVLRGVVDFQWRVKKRTKSGHRRTVVVRTLHANTKGEHPSPGADPTGYSSGTCEIR
ncbi:MAG TPA: hypothetical protein VJU79_03230 [Candidatus Dormibacteraeota bacterium]|nr:hypothetical protein [Candidatus Dormibacteraeota bacterium]